MVRFPITYGWKRPERLFKWGDALLKDVEVGKSHEAAPTAENLKGQRYLYVCDPDNKKQRPLILILSNRNTLKLLPIGKGRGVLVY